MEDATIKPTVKTGRIEYIDALRGFTIFLVVLWHVAVHCWRIPNNVPSIHIYLVQVRMPMFFFISGFVLYKQGVVWNGKQIAAFFKKKIPVQLVATFIFFSVFVHVMHLDMVEQLKNDYKAGYWFTYILFIYYVIYAAVRFCLKNNFADIVLILIGICLYPSNLDSVQHATHIRPDILSILSFTNWRYFIFFVVGSLTRKYFKKAEQLLDGKWFITMCIIVNFIAFCLINKFVKVPETLTNVLFSFSGVAILFAFFRKKQDLFSKDRFFGRAIQYTGRRTLDIYFIHYFLLPKSLFYVTKVFIEHPMPIIEAFASSIIAILIVATCLLISNIIRLSPWLAHLLFGVKRQ